METIKKGLEVNKEFDEMFKPIDKIAAAEERLEMLKKQLHVCTEKLNVVNRDLEAVAEDRDMLVVGVGLATITRDENVWIPSCFAEKYSVGKIIDYDKARSLYDTIHAKFFRLTKQSTKLYKDYSYWIGAIKEVNSYLYDASSRRESTKELI